MVNAKGIDAAKIESWLRDIGCDPHRAIDPNSNWRFDLAFPPNTSHQISVLNPKMPARAIVIVSGAALSPSHVAAFENLDEDAKQEFALAFQEALNRDHIESTIQGTSSPVTCPSGFQIISVIFDDGLSLDTLVQRMSAVYKAELAGILCINRHMGPGHSGGFGEFDFKRLGVQ